MDVENASVSTSGDYEHFFIIDGVRYHHVLAPRTMSPSKRHPSSVQERDNLDQAVHSKSPSW